MVAESREELGRGYDGVSEKLGVYLSGNHPLWIECRGRILDQPGAIVTASQTYHLAE